ncbi:MAG TPA: hypothetical protein VMT70_12890 [Vicinamibacteria bacterium]|nr:hypothetical protein [Vicinamibacteria bacterium]
MGTVVGEPERRPTSGPSLARVAAFVVLVVTAELWAVRHLGYGLTSPGRVGQWAAVASAAVAVLGRVFGESRFEPLFAKLRSAADLLMAVPVLVVGGAVLAYLAATRSSVIVLTAERGPIEMQLEALHPGYASSPPEREPGFTRFFVSVNPLGTPFRLRVRGFVPASFEVSPLVGRTVRLEDLRPSPSVLVRPSLLAVRELEQGRIVVRRDGERGPLIASSDGPTSALVGPRRPLPADMLEEWKLELESQEVVGAPAAAAFLAWKRARWVDPAVDLETGMTLFARAETAGGTPLAEGRITLGPDPIVELSLVDVRAR